MRHKIRPPQAEGILEVTAVPWPSHGRAATNILGLLPVSVTNTLDLLPVSRRPRCPAPRFDQRHSECLLHRPTSV